VPEHPVLLYDGTCGLCAGSVQFVLRHDPNGSLHFAALQSGFGQAVLARHAELRGVDSMLWVDPGYPAGSTERVHVLSDAVLRACEYLGGWWGLLRVGRAVPRVLRDSLYRTVARHRHKLVKSEQCLVPTPEQRPRFIE
jgi:predicted DCC family thiol-disulfide oxidoreductase YuxK